MCVCERERVSRSRRWKIQRRHRDVSRQAKLEADVAPIAARELAALLEAKPTVDDDATEVSEEEDSWHRAAWYGWQFMSLRGAKRFMPATADALRRAAGGSRRSGPAHRCVVLAWSRVGRRSCPRRVPSVLSFRCCFLEHRSVAPLARTVATTTRRERSPRVSFVRRRLTARGAAAAAADHTESFFSERRPGHRDLPTMGRPPRVTSNSADF